MNTLNDKGGYAPTFAVVNGFAQMIHLETVILSAFNEVVNKGNLGELANIKILVPVFFKNNSFTTDDLLVNFSNDKILVNFDPTRGNYEFGPIDTKTVELALKAINDGEPVYRELTIRGTGIFTDEFIAKSQKIVSMLKTRMTLTDNPFIIYTEDKGEYFAEMYTNLSNLIFYILSTSAKKLNYTKVYRNEDPKPMTLQTGIKTLQKMVDYKETVFANLVFAETIKEVSAEKTVSLIHEQPLELGNFFDLNKKAINSKLQGLDKAYIGGIYSEYTELGKVLSKKDIIVIKEFANSFSKLVTQVEKVAKTVVVSEGVVQ